MSRLLLYHPFIPTFSPVKDTIYSKWLIHAFHGKLRIKDVEEEILYTASKYGRIDIITANMLLLPTQYKKTNYCAKALCYTGYYFNFIKKHGNTVQTMHSICYAKTPLLLYAIMGNQWDLVYLLKDTYRESNAFFFSYLSTAMGNRVLYNLLFTDTPRYIKKAAAKLVNTAYKVWEKELYQLGTEYIKQWNSGYNSIELEI